MSYLLERVKETWRRDGAGAVADEAIAHLRWRLERTAAYGAIRTRELELRNRHVDADPLQLTWVDPADIEYVVAELVPDETDDSHFERPNVPTQGRDGIGAVRGGEWDLSAVPFTDLSEYRLFEQHFREDVPWAETAFVERHRRSPASDWSERKLLNKLERFDALYETIATEGYSTQRELGGHPLNEIVVYAGRNGELRWHENGRHRLAIAKLLELESVPVLITVRHRKLLFPGERSRPENLKR
ncbi:hypothetical protein [Natronococcus occultus]|uniref:ParB-like nuclease n=1 Tax=Natronococcus occultus SP4 TaxID=694430 RepID=L0K2U1_9EURY|nr:hypothetical protein [Natronococcus occultus]AGB38423.1 hypothetical protein Natoc_2661 [Natronococcus occultus SP4]